MYAAERQQAIVDLVHQDGRVSVTALAEHFKVTTETIRRDLDVLETDGVLERVHGGAILAGKRHRSEAGLALRESRFIEAKAAIARAAVGIIPNSPETTILLDAGTTTAQLAALLPASRVRTVVTNSVPIASALAGREITQVQLLGGRLRGLTQATVGATTVAEIQRLQADVVFLGTNGFSEAHGFSTPDPSEAAVKQALTAAAHRVVVLADSSKADTDYLVSFAALSDVDLLITDANLPGALHQALVTHGIEVVVA